VLAFARRRFGAEAAGFLAGPMVAGIYAGDAAELSMEAAFPRIAALESAHGSVVRGALAAMLQRRRERATSEGRSHDARPAPTGGAAPGAGGAASFGGRLTSFPLGLAELCARLAGRLEKVVRTDAPVRRLARDGTRWAVELDSGEVEPADVVVLAVPPDGAARLVAGLGGAAGAALGTALAGIPLAPVVVVALGFERAAVRHPLDGFGFLVPPGEGPRSLGVLFASSVFPGQAPAGKVLLRAIVGGARDPTAVTLDDELLVRAVREDLRATLGLTAEPVYRRIVRWPAGIPQYNLGHVQRVSAADRAGETLGGLVLGGNALRGVAFNACVENGASVAASVGRLLARTVVDARG
jgi:oxygen-dependent protoporphyrinogen oxidase